MPKTGCPIMVHNRRISKPVSLNTHCHLATQNCHMIVILAVVHFAPRLQNITALISSARVPPLATLHSTIDTSHISPYNITGKQHFVRFPNSKPRVSSPTGVWVAHRLRKLCLIIRKPILIFSENRSHKGQLIEWQ